MKKCIFILVASFQLISSYGQYYFSGTLNKEDVSSKTDELISEYVDLGIFSGVVLIAENGKPIYEKACGLSNRETNTPNTLETRFVIGSMNKSFTKTVILQLIEERKLNLEDKMVDFLEGFKQRSANKITINQLLNHTSGFGDYHNPSYWELTYEQKNIQSILEILKNIDLLFEPGTENEYSNAGYIILGEIIEKVSGQSYAKNVEDRIVKPLQLSSFVTSNVKEIPNRAIGYTKIYSGYTNNEEFISEPRSDGGFYANAYDILKFYRAYFYDNKLISESAKSTDGFFKMIANAYSEKGAGIPLAGGFNGANTVHMEMLADNISIVVCANMDEPVAENLAHGIHSIINGRVPKNPLLPTKLSVYAAYKDNGIGYVRENFDELTTNWFERDPKDLILNNLGYDLLFDKKLNDALEIFKLNVELFPDIANCWDSYGEALLKIGNKEAALSAYKKALEINPNMPSAKKAVKELDN